LETELKKLIIGAAAALVLSTAAMAQTTYYTGPNGQPLGSSNAIGGTTYYTGPNGMPRGTANTIGQRPFGR
jgi:hypothetical protein